MTATLDPAARPSDSAGPASSAPLYPPSSGKDGLERLEAAWQKPRRFGFFTEIVNNHIGVLYVATRIVIFVGAG